MTLSRATVQDSQTPTQVVPSDCHTVPQCHLVTQTVWFKKDFISQRRH